MSSFTQGEEFFKNLTKSAPASLGGTTYDIMKRPVEASVGLALGTAKSIPDVFVYPTLLTGSIAGKLGKLANIPGSTELAEKSGKGIESYEEAFRDLGSQGIEGIRQLAPKSISPSQDETSQKALRAGLIGGSFLNPAAGLKKIPAFQSGVGKTASDILEQGAVGLATKGITKGQELFAPALEGLAGITGGLDVVGVPLAKGLKKTEELASKIIPGQESKFVRGAVGSLINPQSLTEQFKQFSPENPTLLLNIQKKINTFAPSIEDMGEALGKRQINNEIVNNWVDSLTKPLNARSFNEIVANSKITNNPNELNQALSFAFDNDPQKIKIAKKFIDLGNIDAVPNLSKEFNVKFGDWKNTLPDTLGDVQITPEQAAILKNGLSSGIVSGRAKVDPIEEKMFLQDKLGQATKETTEASQKSELFKKSIQDEQLSYQNRIKEASDLYKQKRIEYINQKPILDKEHQINTQQLKDLEAALAKKDPDQINLIKSDIDSATQELKEFKQSLKKDPKERLTIKKDYFDAKKALSDFEKANKEVLQEGQQMFPEAQANLLQKKAELESQLEQAKTNYFNLGKPNEIEAGKLAELEARIAESKTKLKTYERVLTPDEEARLEEFRQKTAQSQAALDNLKAQHEEFKTSIKQQMKSYGEQKKDFTRNVLPTRKQEAKAHDELASYHAEAQKNIESKIKAVENQSTSNLFKNVENAILKNKTKGSTNEIIDSLNRKKLTLQNELEKLPDALRQQKFTLQDELRQNLQGLNRLQTELNKPNPAELESLSARLSETRNKLNQAQAEFSVRPTPELQSQIATYQQEANNATNQLRGYKRQPTADELNQLNTYQEAIKNTKNKIASLEEGIKANQGDLRLQLQEIENQIAKESLIPNQGTAISNWLNNGVKRDLLVSQEKLREAVRVNNPEDLKKYQEEVSSIVDKAKNQVVNLDLEEESKKVLLADLDVFAGNATTASRFNRVFMFGQLEPYLGQMLQFISTSPAVKDFKLQLLGKTEKEFMEATKGFNKYKTEKAPLIESELIRPNKIFTDAFGLPTTLESELAAPAAVNTSQLLNLARKKPDGFWKGFDKITEIFGYGQAEKYKLASIDIAMKNSYAITKMKAEMAGIKEGSKEFDNLFLQETKDYLEMAGERSGNTKFVFKDPKTEQYQINSTWDKGFNQWLLNTFGNGTLAREGKDFANTLISWVSSAHRGLMRSYNNMGSAVDAIAKRGYSTQADRKAILSFASDVATNAVLFGVRGASRFPTGLTESPGDVAFAQTNKYTWPMALSNAIFKSINLNDDQRRLYLEGALGAKAQEKGEGGIGTALERQKTIPLPVMNLFQGAGFDIIQSKLGSMGSGVFNNVIKDTYNDLRRKEGMDKATAFYTAVNGAVFTLADTFISKDIKNLTTAYTEGQIKNPKGENITPNLGEPSRLDVITAAALKNKPSTLSLGESGMTQAGKIRANLEKVLNTKSLTELKTMEDDGEALLDLLTNVATENGLDINKKSAQDIVWKAYEGIKEDKTAPKFLTTKYKQLQSNAKTLLSLTPGDPIAEEIVGSISKEELPDLVGMALISGKRGKKVANVLIKFGLVNETNIDELMEKGEAFQKRHEKALTPEMYSYFNKEDDNTEETPTENSTENTSL